MIVAPQLVLKRGLASINFATAKTGSFVQEPPHHENPYLADAFLRRNLQRLLPKECLESIEPDLVRFGDRVATECWRLGRQCEENPPVLRQTTAWGQRTDEIVTCEAWKQQKAVAAEEGLVAIGYERRQDQFSRLYQYVKLGLFAPASGLYSCPLAMTDGAAKTIENENLNLKEAFARLTSRDPDRFWTSGQWMTEKGGGSDVGQGTETLAVKCQVDPDLYTLHGYKWFSSATDSDMTLTLARIMDEASGASASGSRGISMFFLETKHADGRLVTNSIDVRICTPLCSLNGIQVQKLKNKLGTRQLPTGELLLDGARARLVSEAGRGIPSITGMLLITRLHNVTSSVSYMRKMTLLARDYALRRKAFGKLIKDHPLHIQTLSRMETETRGCTILLLDLAHKLGLAESGQISETEAHLLRMINPVAKMYTAKQSVAVTSEGLECFGGQGYIEDTGLPGLLRDAQVTPIWEGTSNIMSLDLLRALTKSQGQALLAMASTVLAVTEKAEARPGLAKSAAIISKSMNQLLHFVKNNINILEVAGRDLCVSVAHVYISSLLLEHALTCEKDMATLDHWLQTRDLVPVVTNHQKGAYGLSHQVIERFVFDGYDPSHIHPPVA